MFIDNFHMDLKRDELLFKKDECWKESEKRFLQNEWRNSKESLESMVSSSSLINSVFSKSLSSSQERVNDDFSVMIDDDFPLGGELFYQFSNISIINRVFCDISSVKYTTYSENKPIFYFLSIFFLILSLLLIERSWNCVVQVKIDYDNFNQIPNLFESDIKIFNDTLTENLAENSTIHEFTVEKTLYDPIFVYYGINGFYSNTKEFVSSKPPELFGYGYKCTHILTIQDILKYRPDIKKYLAEFFRVPVDFDFSNIDKLFSKKKKKSRIFKIGRNSPNTNILCGLPIYSLFTDEIKLIKKSSNNENIFIRRTMDYPEDQWKYKLLHNFRQYITSIVEKNFKIKKYNKLKIKEKIPQLSIMLSRWWTQSISPNFIKPYGIITSSYEYNQMDDVFMYPGTYELNITSNSFPNNAWGAEKYILLTNLSIFGGKQYLAATLCLIISIIYALIIYFDPKRAQIIIINNKIEQKFQ